MWTSPKQLANNHRPQSLLAAHFVMVGGAGPAAGQPWSCCPRSALKRALAQLESRHGLTLVAGFELEFVLLKPAPVELFKAFPEAASTTTVLCSGGQAWVPLDSTIYCQTAALDTVSTEGGLQLWRGCLLLSNPTVGLSGAIGCQTLFVLLMRKGCALHSDSTPSYILLCDRGLAQLRRCRCRTANNNARGNFLHPAV